MIIMLILELSISAIAILQTSWASCSCKVILVHSTIKCCNWMYYIRKPNENMCVNFATLYPCLCQMGF